MYYLIQVDSEGTEVEIGLLNESEIVEAMLTDDRDAYDNPYSYRLKNA